MLSGLRFAKIIRSSGLSMFSTSYAHDVEATADFRKLATQFAGQPHVILFYSNYGKPSLLLKKKIEGKVEGLKKNLITVDVELAPEVCEEYHVESVPTLFTLKGASIKDTFVGMPNDDKINELVKAI